MIKHRLGRLAVAGAVLAAGAGFAAPASAAVTYDPATMTGFAGATEVRRAFGWSAATLAARAGGVTFEQDFWTDDTYSVACGRRAFPVVHHREFGRFALTDAVVRRRGPRSATGYGDRIGGFRLTGASSGISGTSVAPAAGQPCPRGGGTVDRVRLVSSATGWSLGATSGELHRVLLVRR